MASPPLRPDPEPAQPEGLQDLCPLVRAWFSSRFREPTGPQRLGWPAIARGEDTLIAAPTGSGKTLAAFLVAIDGLVRRALDGPLPDRTEVVYVSPLRALAHDIQKNLEGPLEEIQELAREQGVELGEIRAAVRTGDTPPAERARMIRKPPHILVTTPESLFLLITAEKSRAFLGSVTTIIVDEIHALGGSRRGAHLALTLERLEHHLEGESLRIGLSATARPLPRLARFLVSNDRLQADGSPRCRILDLGHQRDLDLGVIVPESDDLEAVPSTEQWGDLIDILSGLIREHRTTLVFVNTRRLAERVTHRLKKRLGDDEVAAHHGSLSKERRLDAEERLRNGSLMALVATASLELGIDIGHVDLVCQVSSPRSIAAFLQRVGRSGHALGLTPKGRLFPTSRDQLVECASLVRAARAGRLDSIGEQHAPLEVLAQQVIAACAGETWAEDDLFALVTRAAPYGKLERADFDAVLAMCAEGFETPRGRRGRHVHRDLLQGTVRARRGARLAALTSGGTIPETGEYRVLLHPGDVLVGTLEEDFAVESSIGDIFLLGTHSWKIRRVENGVVRVEDAQGQPPTIPFWFGEAPARSPELCVEVSELRGRVRSALAQAPETMITWLEAECGVDAEGARQISRYVEVQDQAVGVVPTREEILVERFFDESGGMQLVVHAPYGARINRGLGLSLRKRFCRAFNQELQAAATDDGVVLSLANPQTFELETIASFLSPKTIRDVLTQAMLGSPLFQVRWRRNAARALAILRRRGSKRVPFNIQRMQAEDLLSAAFPEETACQEHVTWPIDIPDHPLVRQTLDDCLHEAADLDGLTALLQAISSGSVSVRVADTTEPSPFAHELLNAGPFAFLDDAPLEERRTRAVSMRHALPDNVRDLAALSPEAIKAVREEAALDIRDADDLHDALMDLVLMPLDAVPPHEEAARELLQAGRASHAKIADGHEVLFATERLRDVEALYPPAEITPAVQLPAAIDPGSRPPDEALDRALRGHLGILGPVTARDLARLLFLEESQVAAGLVRLETRGILLTGSFDPGSDGQQVCDRSLLARIHRGTLGLLRREIEPVSAQVLYRFLSRWQHVHPETHAAGEGGLLQVLERLSGWSSPAVAWESALLAHRMDHYRPELLDALCLGGHVAWGRLASGTGPGRGAPSRATSISLFLRDESDALLHDVQAGGVPEPAPLREPAERILELLRAHGALFQSEIEKNVRLLPAQIAEGLLELVAAGAISSDAFAAWRRLLRGGRTRRRQDGRWRLTPVASPLPSGRWSVLRALGQKPADDDLDEACAERLLRRYGVVFRDLLARESLPRGWRAVHRALRRFEARGTARGGRFVAGFQGEQFALPEAVSLLRKERKREELGEEITISACDPLNLAGILTPGPRVPAVHTRSLIIRDGLPIAVVEGELRRDLAPSGAMSTPEE